MSTDALFAVSTPFVVALSASSLLRKGSERALVWPGPMMMWMVCAAERGGAAPWYAVALAYGAILAVLLACWRARRSAAQWAVLVCAASALWLQLGPVFAAGRQLPRGHDTVFGAQSRY